MDIRVLQYFLAVAREGSITGAAERLHMTQPPLSRQLKDLEEELGTQLFLRGNRKITLTEEGKILRKRAEELVALMEKTKAEISQSYNDVTEDIYLGCGESISTSLIASAIQRLHKKYPRIRVNLHSGDFESISEYLDRGLLDFGMFIGAADLSKYDYIKLPTADTWGLLVRKDSVFAEKESIKPSDLTDQPLICSRQVLSKNEMAGWFGCPSENLNIISTYNLIFNAAVMVEHHIGYALTLENLVDTSWESKLCFRPLEPRLEASHHIAWRKYQMFSSATEKFIAALQEEIEVFVNDR